MSEEHDPLLERLRQLPNVASAPGPSAKRAVRAAYVASFEDTPAALRYLRMAIVPAVLASVVVLYLGWAFSAASALVQ